MEQYTDIINEKMVLWGPKILMGLLMFLALWVVAIVVRSIIIRVGKNTALDDHIAILFGRIAYIVIICFGIISGLGTMGFNVSALIASLGLTGFALGFALKDALSNVLAGALVLIYRPFAVGDRITVTGLEGNVSEIDLRYTKLQTEEKTILLPNSKLFSNPVIIQRDKSAS